MLKSIPSLGFTQNEKLSEEIALPQEMSKTLTTGLCLSYNMYGIGSGRGSFLDFLKSQIQQTNEQYSIRI